MKHFQDKRGAIATRMSAYEVELLSSLIMQLVELVADGEPDGLVGDPDRGGASTEPADAFDELVRDLQVAPDEPEVPQDPVLRRLFPTAYPDDAAASSDFRRFTERDLRAKKAADAQQVLARLADTDGGDRELRIPPTEVDAWLRTLTSVRLAVATRLGIDDAETAEQIAELPESDPRSYLVSVYDWLGFAQETLIGALGHR